MSDADGKIARTAKGKRPQYFADPAVDKLLSMLLTVIGELSVTRDRLDTLERLLAEKSLIDLEQIERYAPTVEVQREREAQRTAYIQRIFRVLEMELEELDKDGSTRSFEEVYKKML